MTEQVLAKATNLRLVGRGNNITTFLSNNSKLAHLFINLLTAGTGLDNVDIGAATRRGVLVMKYIPYFEIPLLLIFLMINYKCLVHRAVTRSVRLNTHVQSYRL